MIGYDFFQSLFTQWQKTISLCRQGDKLIDELAKEKQWRKFWIKGRFLNLILDIYD